jgi:AraC-like DNA-binding protein
MKVKNCTPAGKVAAYVERILVIENHQVITPFALPLFANGSPTLLFKTATGTIGNTSTTHLTLFGQTIIPETITFTSDYTLIAYFFKPYALHSIFGITAGELTDHPIDLNLLARQQTLLLQDQLLNAGTTANRMALLDNYIARLIADAKGDDPLIKYASTKIVQQPSKEVLVQLQKELHVTERTFQRMFEKKIGIAPNLYRRICQFNSAFQQLNNRKFDKLSDIAFENGYADQSHYIRSFKEFTRLTPKDYLNFGNA